MLKQIYLLFFIGANLIAPLIILLFLNRGIEPSDTGHYYSAIFHLDDINIMTTQFAVVWSLLPLPNDVFYHRIALYTFYVGASIYFAISCMFLLPDNHKKNKLGIVLLISVSLTGMASSYNSWLPDPNYNSMSMILILLIAASAIQLIRLTEHHKVKTKRLSVFLGGLFFLLLFTRPPTAFVLCLLIVLLFILVFYKQKNSLFEILLFSLIGLFATFIFIAVVVEPPYETINRIQNGLTKRELLGIKSVLLSKINTYLGSLSAALLANIPSFFFAIMGISITPIVLKIKPHLKNTRRLFYISIVGELLVVLGLIFAALQLFFYKHGILSTIVGILFITSIGVAFQFSGLKRKNWIKVAFFALLSFILTLSSIIGTSGVWMSSSHVKGSIFVFVAIGITAIALIRESKYWIISSTLLLSASIGSGLAIYKIIVSPYRLPAPLTAQTFLFKSETLGSHLRVDEKSFQFLTAFTDSQSLIKKLPERPILIDLTGKLPLVQTLIGARPARTPWLLSGYEGSNRFFQYIIQQLSNEEISTAWLLYAPGLDKGLDISILEKRGLDLHNNYEIFAETYSPDIKTRVQLLVPKAILKNFQYE